MTDAWADPDLESFLQALLTIAVGSPGPALVVQALGTVIRLIQRRDDDSLLAQISADVQRQMREHLLTGRDLLESACSSTISDAQRTLFLNAALGKFISAKNVLAPPDDVQAVLYAAACYFCLGDTDNGMRTVSDAYTQARRDWRELHDRETKIERPAGIDAVFMWLAVLASVFTADFFFAAVFERMKTKQQDYLLRLFAVETQITFLQRALPALGLATEPQVFYFPADVARVEGSASSLPQRVKCFDRNGQLVMEVMLGLGNRANKRMINLH